MQYVWRETLGPLYVINNYVNSAISSSFPDVDLNENT
jgi:hypothetical protein